LVADAVLSVCSGRTALEDEGSYLPEGTRKRAPNLPRCAQWPYLAIVDFVRLRACMPFVIAALSALCCARQTVTVFAAASLKETFKELGREYEQRHPGAKVIFQFAGSQQLAAQIQQGAKADVFASADERQMEVAIRGKGTEFARNKLVLIVSRQSAARILTYRDLASPGIKLVLGVRDVPVGWYAMQVLEHLARSMEHGWSEQVSANIVSRETDVRAILTKVELGEADAGFVYVTDAKTAHGSVATRPIPDSENMKASYRIAALGNSRAGSEFVQLVVSQNGRKALSDFGFALPK